jgi:hypothetical protein
MTLLLLVGLSFAAPDGSSGAQRGLMVLAGISSDGHVSMPALEEGVSKKGSFLGSLAAGISKLHFIVGLGMFLFVALMVVEESVAARALLTLPVILLYMASKILFAIDQADMAGDIIRRNRK